MTGHRFCSDSDAYTKTLEEAVHLFDRTVEEWDDVFRVFLGLGGFSRVRERMDPYERAVCFYIYTCDKRRWAFEMARKRGNRWKARAIELGHEGPLS